MVCFALVATVGGFYNQDEGGAGIGGGGKGGEREEGGGEGGEPGVGGNSRFLLRESLDVVRTDAGHMRVIRNGGHRLWRSPMHMGLITMEPNSLFIPQYLDSNLILFVRRGILLISQSLSTLKSFLVVNSTLLDYVLTYLY